MLSCVAQRIHCIFRNASKAVNLTQREKFGGFHVFLSALEMKDIFMYKLIFVKIFVGKPEGKKH
jgi:hypothetical protein